MGRSYLVPGLVCQLLSIILCMGSKGVAVDVEAKLEDMRELKALEAEHPELVSADSPTQRVGGKPEGSFAKVAHSRPMLSIDNVNSEEELREWVRRLEELLAKVPG